MPVGCAGPTDAGSIRYSYDADKQTLKLTAQPQIWSEAAWAQALADRDRIEAIEGFWIRRPWLLTDACPMPGADQTSASSSSETLGVAQAFAEGGSRVLRRGRRPYEATVRLDPGVAPTPGAWRLVLKGRLGGGAGGPIRCRLESPDRPPGCLILVEFDQVAFEAADGAVAAEWPG